jgi:hypothetical protein
LDGVQRGQETAFSLAKPFAGFLDGGDLLGTQGSADGAFDLKHYRPTLANFL